MKVFEIIGLSVAVWAALVIFLFAACRIADRLGDRMERWLERRKR